MNLNATILGQDIAFVLFVLFCMKYVWPPILEAIENRQKKIADSLSSAEQIKKNVEKAQNDATYQLKKAKYNAQIIIEKANKQRNQIIEKAKIEAEIERKKIITQAQKEIDFERKCASEELRKEVVMLAIKGAEKIIERSLDKDANRDIIDKIIATL